MLRVLLGLLVPFLLVARSELATHLAGRDRREVTADIVLLTLSLAAIGAYDHSAVTLAAMYISAGYTGTIGTTSAYWQISATLLYLGTPIGGSGSAAGRSAPRAPSAATSPTARPSATGRPR